MADYTDYNPGMGNKGVIIALVLLTVLIAGLIWIGANAPSASDGTTGLDPAASVQTAPVPAPVPAD